MAPAFPVPERAVWLPRMTISPEPICETCSELGPDLQHCTSCRKWTCKWCRLTPEEICSECDRYCSCCDEERGACDCRFSYYEDYDPDTGPWEEARCMVHGGRV